MSITIQDIEHIAALARLGITDEEKEQYATDLARILDYFEKLKNADTADIQPIQQITNLDNITRDDKEKSTDDTLQEKLLENAPTRKNNFIKVKSVL